jgi:hypothetical protein
MISQNIPGCISINLKTRPSADGVEKANGKEHNGVTKVMVESLMGGGIFAFYCSHILIFSLTTTNDEKL